MVAWSLESQSFAGFLELQTTSDLILPKQMKNLPPRDCPRDDMCCFLATGPDWPGHCVRPCFSHRPSRSDGWSRHHRVAMETRPVHGADLVRRDSWGLGQPGSAEVSPPQWSMSNFSCSLSKNTSTYSMEILAFHCILDEKWLYYQFSLDHLHIFSLRGWENVLFGICG